MIDVSVHAKGVDFSVKRAGPSLRTQWLQIGAHGCSVFLDDADLIRLRDVIDAHLATAAAGIVDRSAA